MDERDAARTRPDTIDLDPGVAATSLDDELVRRAVRAGALFSAVGAALFGVFYQLTGPSEFFLPNVATAVCLVAVAAIRPRDATVALWIGLSIGLLLFGYELIRLGGVDNGVTVWLLAPNVGALILGARRVAIYCATVSGLEIVGVVVARHLGWLTGGLVVAHADIVMAASMVAVVALCGIFAHITVRARRGLMRDVEARNAALAAALEEARTARSAAVAAAEAKDRFFANLTHEIRTPLTGIAGSAELLLHTGLSAEQAPLAGALRVSTENLVSLVNAMLEHARLRAGHVAVERAPVEVRLIAGDMAQLFRTQAADKGVALSLVVADDVPERVVTDGIKLRQIVGNLVSNAIKFTARGSVEVRMGLGSPPGAGRDPELIVDVADTGVGIPPDLLDAVFEPFVQGDPSIARLYGGTGLGLAIARQLAGLMGGTLLARSRPGEGSTFTLTLPVGAAGPARPEAGELPARPEAATRGVRVLLAEDNAINQAISSAMLRGLGADCLIAENGHEAVEMALAGGFDIILMDLQMPGLDGIEAAREIRRRGVLARGRPVPIVALTGNAAEDYGDECRAAGMNGFLIKPVGTAELRRVLEGVDAGS
jgi:signal transduction histidine kinase